jgi:hypothetical protein
MLARARLAEARLPPVKTRRAREREKVIAYVLARMRAEEKAAGRGWQSELHRRTGMTTAHISSVLGEKRGMGDAFLHAMASYWGMTYAQLEALALGHSPEPATWDPPIDVFLLRVSRDEGLPGLRDAITKHPGRWRTSTVVRAASMPLESGPDGQPVGGWVKLLDAIEHGTADQVTGGAQDAIAKAAKQIGPRPALPPAVSK